MVPIMSVESDRLNHRRRILFVGSCGYVGHLIAHAFNTCDRWWNGRPYRMSGFDIRRCQECSWPPWHVVIGDATDLGDLFFAAKGMDTIVYMAEGDLSRPETLFLASVYGFYNALMVARAQHVRRVILLSTLSVHSDQTGSIENVRNFDEDTPPQCDHPDGITVLIGEWLGRYFAETFGMSIFALRISSPTADDIVRSERSEHGDDPIFYMTAASDLMDAILRTVEIEDHVGFEIINIVGDPTGERVDTSKAERILGWRRTI